MPERYGEALSEGSGAPEAGLERTLEEIIANVRRLVALDAAAFVAIDWEAGRIHPAAAWFADDDVRRALLPVLDRRYDAGRPGLTESAVESGRALLVRRVEEWAGRGGLRERLLRDLDEAQAELTWRWYTRASAIACPVQAPDGRSLGVLAISSTPPLAPLDEEALRVVEVFADLAAVALDRAQLLEAEARRSGQELLLNEAGRAVSESLELDVVYRRIVEQAAAVTAATKVQLTRYRPSLQQLESVATVGFSDEVAVARFGRGEGMIGRVAESRRPYRSRPEDRERFIDRVMEREGIGSFVHVPIELGPRLFGVLSAGHQEEAFFDDAQVEQLLKFSRLAAAAIANAADYQHEVRVARALTRGFVPSEPGRLPGVELGLRYEPAESDPTGGDVYGAWRTADGAMAILIGDASGRGVEVAGLASMVRFFVEARSLARSSPAEVLRETNQLLRARLPAESFVTAFLGFLRDGELRYCNAGHPAPLIVPPRGEPRELGGTGMPLGVGGQLEDAAERLGSGEILFAYTDGLSEARRGGEQFGQAELGRSVARRRAGGSARALVHAVYEDALAWAGALEDDVTVLALGTRVSGRASA